MDERGEALRMEGYNFLMEEGPEPIAKREWTMARIVRGVSYLTRPDFLKRQWGLRVVKPRFGIETIRDFIVDEKFGGRCGGTYRSRWNHLGYRGTSSTHYYYLSKIFNGHNVVIGPDDVLVDIGCGKGRLLNFWLHTGLGNRMVGVEIDERWADFAAKRLSKYPNVEVRCGDAFELTPKEGTVFFIFNPFSRETTARFKDHLESLATPDSEITLVYYMCNYADLFEDDPKWVVSPVHENTYHPAIVARLSKASVDAA